MVPRKPCGVLTPVRPGRSMRTIMPPVEIRHHHRMEGQPTLLAVELEDARELLDRRIGDGDLVGNTAKERFVYKVVCWVAIDSIIKDASNNAEILSILQKVGRRN